MQRGRGAVEGHFGVFDVQTLVAGGHIGAAGIAWINRSGMSRLIASVIAHLAALIAASDPSMPTTIRDCG
ncbi:hypothetical protein NIIDMKKI_24330 [Mycobacterium kansasii]|uniref:Uncharacterized protein n=1 Tax=Mycobacterium kansasii TaxID=1768 RepID=A0A7G1I8F6_MYCKA|nr:hypothetical protein NIIDMKKI_24330 [Mycobacterium kansasii]